MTKRLFLSIPLPTEYIESISEWSKEYIGHKDIRLTPHGNLHITAAFLGDVEESQIDGLVDVLANNLSNKIKFDLKFKGISLAPTGGRPRMIWANFSFDQSYIDLVENIWLVVKDFVDEDIYAKRKQATAHVTLARFKKPIKMNLEKLKVDDKIIRVDRIDLMKSELRPDGPYYTIIKTYE